MHNLHPGANLHTSAKMHLGVNLNPLCSVHKPINCVDMLLGLIFKHTTNVSVLLKFDVLRMFRLVSSTKETVAVVLYK